MEWLVYFIEHCIKLLVIKIVEHKNSRLVRLIFDEKHIDTICMIEWSMDMDSTELKLSDGVTYIPHIYDFGIETPNKITCSLMRKYNPNYPKIVNDRYLLEICKSECEIYEHCIYSHSSSQVWLTEDDKILLERMLDKMKFKNHVISLYEASYLRRKLT